MFQESDLGFGLTIGEAECNKQDSDFLLGPGLQKNQLASQLGVYTFPVDGFRHPSRSPLIRQRCCSTILYTLQLDSEYLQFLLSLLQSFRKICKAALSK